MELLGRVLILFIALTIGALIVYAFGECLHRNVEKDNGDSIDMPVILDDSLRFITLAEYDAFDVICNVKTRVMYSMGTDDGNYGALTLLVEQNGDPMVYTGKLPADSALS